MKKVIVLLLMISTSSVWAADQRIEGAEAERLYSQLLKDKAADVVLDRQDSPSQGERALRKGETECKLTYKGQARTYVCLRPANAQADQSAGASQVDANLNADEFCEKYKSSLGEGQSLRALRGALGVSTSLGQSAKNSTAALKNLGFHEVPLKDPYDLPTGTILVLEKNGGCPVSSQHGHVAVKCGPDSMVWSKEQQGKSLSGFIKDHPSCVKSVLVNKAWDKSYRARPSANPKRSGSAQ